MIANLIREHGFRWSDFDDMTEEDLFDLVNSKAQLKKKKRTTAEQKGNPSTSMEDFLKQNGLL
jgi:non-homologous end joining protein Ku